VILASSKSNTAPHAWLKTQRPSNESPFPPNEQSSSKPDDACANASNHNRPSSKSAPKMQTPPRPPPSPTHGLPIHKANQSHKSMSTPATPPQSSARSPEKKPSPTPNPPTKKATHQNHNKRPSRQGPVFFLSYSGGHALTVLGKACLLFITDPESASSPASTAAASCSESPRPGTSPPSPHHSTPRPQATPHRQTGSSTPFSHP